jgi:hypothetical protein
MEMCHLIKNRANQSENVKKADNIDCNLKAAAPDAF